MGFYFFAGLVLCGIAILGSARPFASATWLVVGIACGAGAVASGLTVLFFLLPALIGGSGTAAVIALAAAAMAVACAGGVRAALAWFVRHKDEL